MSARTCPVPGCGAPLKHGHLLCKGCWFAVPAAERRAVHSTWRKFRYRLDGDDAEAQVAALATYREATDAAIAIAAARFPVKARSGGS